MAMVLFMIDFFQLRRMEKAEEKAELVAAENEAQKIQSNSVYSLDKRKPSSTHALTLYWTCPIVKCW